jgi:Rrf2 family transcriptional regulator, iron-sulfur cluster assembly transcription factor
MKLSTKGRYAVSAMLDVFIHQRSSCVALSDIVKRQNISLSYLEQLFAKLKKAQLVKSTRGPGGGYMLSQDPNDINVAMIITAVDEKIEARNCEGRGRCHNDYKCSTHELWSGLNDTIKNYLTNINLASLTNNHEKIQQEHVKKEKLGNERKKKRKSLNSLIDS